jgi:hypothetical protein
VDYGDCFGDFDLRVEKTYHGDTEGTEKRLVMRDIEQIIRLVNDAAPSVMVHQLQVRHPGADDDGLWFFTRPGIEFEVQIESSTGMCTFLIETDENDTRYNAYSVEDAVERLTLLLHLHQQRPT